MENDTFGFKTIGDYQSYLISFNIDLQTLILILQQNIDYTLTNNEKMREIAINAINRPQNTSKPRGPGTHQNTKPISKTGNPKPLEPPKPPKKDIPSLDQIKIGIDRARKIINDKREILSVQLTELTELNEKIAPYRATIASIKYEIELLKPKPGDHKDDIKLRKAMIEEIEEAFLTEQQKLNAYKQIEYDNRRQVEIAKLYDLENKLTMIRDKLIKIRDHIKKLLGSSFNPELTKPLIISTSKSSKSSHKKVVKEYTTTKGNVNTKTKKK